jgi:hypothetical protein
METYVRHGLLERARNQEELANRAIDNDLPSLAAFHQDKAKQLRIAAGEPPTIWRAIEPEQAIVADPEHLMGHPAFWILVGLGTLAVIAVAVYFFTQVKR